MTPCVERNLVAWDERFAARPWGRYPSEPLVRFVGRNYPAPKRGVGLFALEVGCGPGPNLWFLAREGFKVAGIDGSANALKLAAQRLKDERMEGALSAADLRQGNFAKLPWPDETFDLVIDIEAIYANTFDVIESVIGEIFRVLKPGGRFFGQLFGPQTSGARTGRMIERNTTADPVEGPFAGFGLMHSFEETELRKLFESFTITSLDWAEWTSHNRNFRHFEWLLAAQKPASSGS